MLRLATIYNGAVRLLGSLLKTENVRILGILKHYLFLSLLTFLSVPGRLCAQDLPVRIFISPLISDLDRRPSWLSTYDPSLKVAVQKVLSQKPFEIIESGQEHVLTLAAPAGVLRKNETYLFTVVFSVDGLKLSEAVEYCPTNKLSECTDQLILDTLSAAR